MLNVEKITIFMTQRLLYVTLLQGVRLQHQILARFLHYLNFVSYVFFLSVWIVQIQTDLTVLLVIQHCTQGLCMGHVFALKDITVQLLVVFLIVRIILKGAICQTAHH